MTTKKLIKASPSIGIEWRAPSWRDLRLRTAGVGLNEIARRVGVAPSTVRLTLKRLASTGLSWPLPAEMTDAALEATLFAAAGTKQGHRRHLEPDWCEIHRELKRKHVTLAML